MILLRFSSNFRRHRKVCCFFEPKTSCLALHRVGHNNTSTRDAITCQCTLFYYFLITCGFHRDSKVPFPYVIAGESGSGKTSLVAYLCLHVFIVGFDYRSHLVVEMSNVVSMINSCLVVRFIGTTTASYSIEDILRSICQQISDAYSFGNSICRLFLCSMSLLLTTEIPKYYDDLVDLFHQFLYKVPETKPLFLILDSLDQLSKHHNGANLAWLPSVFPSSVRIILSTLPDEKYLYSILIELLF